MDEQDVIGNLLCDLADHLAELDDRDPEDASFGEFARVDMRHGAGEDRGVLVMRHQTKDTPVVTITVALGEPTEQEG